MSNETLVNALARSLSIQNVTNALARPLSSESVFSSESQIFDVTKNLSSTRTFSQGIAWTQQVYFWICLEIIYPQKLFPRETNTQILRNLNFSSQKLPKILGHSWRQLPLKPNYSMSREGSTSHMADLGPSHSRAAKFSWTSRFQNPKLHTFNL